MNPPVNPSGAGMPPDWSRLLEAARHGDDEALGVICESLYEYLLLIAHSGLGKDLRNKLGASDVVQQSLMEAHRDFDRFDGDSEKEFRAWTVRLLQRNLIDVARHYRGAAQRDISRETSLGVEPTQFLPSKEANASQIARRRESDQELADAVAGLPERQRLVVEMRHRDDKSYEEIATHLSTTEQAARKLYGRAVQALRRQLVPTDESTA